MSELERGWAERLGDAGEGAKAGAAIGATLGSVVPGVGTVIGGAAGGVIGGLVGLARELTGQPHADAEAPALAKVAQVVAGVADTAQAEAVLRADPIAAERFRVEALGIRAAAEQARDAHFLALVQAADKDRADARAQNLALVQAGSPLAWGAPVVGALVLAAFGTAMVLALLRAIPQGSETVINVLLGTLAAMATQVVNYYLGSSVGSARKDSVLAVERERR